MVFKSNANLLGSARMKQRGIMSTSSRSQPLQVYDEVRWQCLDGDAFARFHFATVVGFNFIAAVKNLRQRQYGMMSPR